MNGQLILLLLTLVLQSPNVAIYPGAGDLSRGPGPAAKGASGCDIGYATDPNDGKYCMIVQIHPDAVAIFGKGDAGQELPVTIRSDYRSFVEKVIIRVGTGPVENIPPSAAKMSENRTNGPGFIADLKSRPADFQNRTPVNIDLNPNLMNVSAQSGINNDAEVFPPTTGKSGPQGSASGIAGNPNRPVLPGSPMLPNNQVTPENSIMPGNPSTYSAGTRANDADSFGAPPSSTSYRDDPNTKLPLYNPIKSNPSLSPNSTNNHQNPAYTNNGTYSGAANNGTYPGGANYGTGSNLSYPNNGANAGATNGGVVNNGTQGVPYPTIATNSNPANPNQTNYPAFPNQNSSSLPSQPTSLTHNQNYGGLPPSGPNYGASPYQPPLPTTTFAGPPNLDTRSSSHLSGNRQDGGAEDPNVGRESMLPFLLLFSIVGNVYLGLWMNHLRKRYRELRISMRGLPVSELA